MGANRRLKLFIASSSAFLKFFPNGSIDVTASNNGDLKPIIEGITLCGYDAIPWYDNLKFFCKSESLLVNLINASKRFDGAVIVIGKDESTTSDVPDSEHYLPNSNVLLEMGMFLSSHGKDGVFHIIDKNKHSEIRLPSDLQGYIYTDLNTSNLKDEFGKFFGRKKSSDLFDKITFYHGEKLTNSLIMNSYKTDKWKSKGLYIGTESARLWDKIESHETYNRNISFLSDFIKKCKRKKVDFRDLNNIISLGSGNGKTDKKLVNEIKKINNSICYVPVDINPYMAFIATREISSIPVRVPFAIIDDFEDNIDHIQKIINNKTHIIGHNNLFSLLGVTFSNLEDTEDNIFLKLQEWMDTDDYLLLDALIQNGEEKVNVINELYNILLNNDTKKPAYKHLIINSIKKKYREDNYFNLSYTDIKKIATNPHSYIRISEMDRDSIENYTIIEKTTVLDCFLEFCGKKHTLLVAKRYEYNKLLDKIKQYFTVIHSSENKETNRGLFLLKVEKSK